MQNNPLLGGGGDGGVISGGLMSNLLREENNNMVMSSEESSSYPDESELELGLALSLGGGGKGKSKPPPPAAAAGGVSWDRYARILTAEDFRSVVSTKVKASSSASSSSSSVTKANNNNNNNSNNNNGCCGTKRTAESPSSPPGRSSISQVVGWPPVRTYRMNSLANAKTPITEDFFSTIDKCKSNNIITVVDKTNNGGNMDNNSTANEKGFVKKSLFVKVNMDGIPIGRKVDMNAHSCYRTLAHSLDEMFRPSAALGTKRSSVEEPLRLLEGSSDFVLTYEDKDGDWMLVGDVPWEMFFSSVRRLRIMRKAEANGLAPGSHEKNRRQLTVHI